MPFPCSSSAGSRQLPIGFPLTPSVFCSACLHCSLTAPGSTALFCRALSVLSLRRQYIHEAIVRRFTYTLSLPLARSLPHEMGFRLCDERRNATRSNYSHIIFKQAVPRGLTEVFSPKGLFCLFVSHQPDGESGVSFCLSSSYVSRLCRNRFLVLAFWLMNTDSCVRLGEVGILI